MSFTWFPNLKEIIITPCINIMVPTMGWRGREGVIPFWFSAYSTTQACRFEPFVEEFYFDKLMICSHCSRSSQFLEISFLVFIEIPHFGNVIWLMTHSEYNNYYSKLLCLYRKKVLLYFALSYSVGNAVLHEKQLENCSFSFSDLSAVLHPIVCHISLLVLWGSMPPHPPPRLPSIPVQRKTKSEFFVCIFFSEENVHYFLSGRICNYVDIKKIEYHYTKVMPVLKSWSQVGKFTWTRVHCHSYHSCTV